MIFKPIIGNKKNERFISYSWIVETINYRFRLSDVHTDMAILATILRRLKLDPNEDLAYRGYLRIGSDMIADHIVCIAEKDRQIAEAAFIKGEVLNEKDLSLLALTHEMMETYRNGQERRFRELRQQYLLIIVREWMEDNNLEIQSSIQ